MASRSRPISADLRTIVLAGLAAAMVFATSSHGQQPETPLDVERLRSAVNRALGVAPRGYETLQPPAQAGVRLADVRVERAGESHRITIDLSQRALTYDPSGDVEVLMDHVIASTAALTGSTRDLSYRFLVNGLPLDQFLSRIVSNGRSSPRRIGAPGRVLVSAGHGWYLHEPSNQWRLQRDYYWGIVEDFVNHDIVRYLEAELRAARLDVRPARHPDRAAGAGTSGQPRWQESAKYYIRDVGAPPTVWDYGADDYAKDINSRPFYANWIDAAVVVSVHNNGGGGTGTETWYDDTNGHQAESRRLAEIVNNKVVAAIRARFNPNWPDRGLRTCNGCKGETRLAARPAILVEVAFMDTRTPDNDALHNETFKQIVAQAIREGLQEWGLRAPPLPEDLDATARHEMGARIAQDPRFAAIVDGSFGRDLAWDGGFELRWLDVTFTHERQLRVWHATARGDTTSRFVGYWDPDTGAWRGWDRVS